MMLLLQLLWYHPDGNTCSEQQYSLKQVLLCQSQKWNSFFLYISTCSLNFMSFPRMKFSLRCTKYETNTFLSSLTSKVLVWANSFYNLTKLNYIILSGEWTLQIWTLNYSKKYARMVLISENVGSMNGKHHSSSWMVNNTVISYLICYLQRFKHNLFI